MAAQRQAPLTCPGHTRPVVHLKFSEVTPKGSFFISACKDGKPMLRRGDTGDWVGTYEGHKGAVWGATVTTDANMAATGAADFTAKLWNAMTGAEICSLQHNHIVKTVAFSPDSSLLLTGCNDKLLRTFDINKPDAPLQELKGQTSSIRAAFFGHKEHTVLAADEGKDINLWDVRSHDLAGKVQMEDPVTSCDQSWDRSLLVVTHGQTVSFVDTKSLAVVKSFPVATRVFTASLAPDHASFVCGGEDCILYKMDYNTGAELESHKSHFGPIHCIRYSPDGEVYASGSEDGTIRLWQQTIGKVYGLWTSTGNSSVKEGSNGGSVEGTDRD